MKARSHPSETSSTRPQLLFHALPGFVLLFLEEEEVDDETDSGAINYPKGDEERVTSACRPGIYATGGEGECSRVDRSPHYFPGISLL